MSLEDLSSKTGIAVPNLSRLEHGKHSPMIETLQKIARALDVPPSALLGRGTRKMVKDS
jgi:transcriptional regulator with XRE-family HTH domain